jgi:hypothetical protein
MGEVGIDISAHRSKSAGDLGGAASNSSPPSAMMRRVPRGSSFPRGFIGDEREILAAFPDVRNRIGSWIKGEFGPGGPLREKDSP